MQDYRIHSIASQVKAWKSEGLKVGFTSGVFDLLHSGHLDYLIQAKEACDRLVVGINSDSSVKANKGPTRPFIPEDQRLNLVGGLKPVDAVFLFAELNNHENIRCLEPHLYIKAGDYNPNQLTSKPLVESYGGKVLLIPVKFKTSSSGIAETILSREISGFEELKEGPARPVIFLDRDGVINEDIGYLHDPKKFELKSGCKEGLARLTKAGYVLVIVSNQAGIGLGYFEHEDFYKINLTMFKALHGSGTVIHKIYYCPHSLSEDCSCRKPATGLLERAFREMNLSKEGSWFIGDRETDILTGKNFGVKTILIKSGQHEQAEARPDHTVMDLNEAAKLIMKA